MLVVIAILLGLILLAMFNKEAAKLSIMAGMGCASFLALLALGAALGIVVATAMRGDTFDGAYPLGASIVGVAVAIATIWFGGRGLGFLFRMMFPETYRRADEARAKRERFEQQRRDREQRARNYEKTVGENSADADWADFWEEEARIEARFFEQEARYDRRMKGHQP